MIKKFIFLFLILILIYFFPLLKGKILLPLDLLVNNYFPWNDYYAFDVKNPYLIDNIVQSYPIKSLVFDSLKNGVLPLWNPYSAAGTPLLAAMQPAVFYPLSLLFVLGNVWGWNLYLLLQIFFSGLFCFLLAREFKLNFWPSVFTAIAFSFNSFLICFLMFATAGQVMAWFPLFLFLASKLLKKLNLSFAIFFCLAIFLSVLAGFFQIFLYGFGLLLFFIFYHYFFYKEDRV